VGEELRGWRWGEPPVAPPPLGVRLSVSEVVGGFCESRRDLYLRRVLRVRVEPNGALKFGAYIHEVFRRALVKLRWRRGLSKAGSFSSTSTARPWLGRPPAPRRQIRDSGLAEGPAGATRQPPLFHRRGGCLRLCPQRRRNPA